MFDKLCEGKFFLCFSLLKNCESVSLEYLNILKRHINVLLSFAMLNNTIYL